MELWNSMTDVNEHVGAHLVDSAVGVGHSHDLAVPLHHRRTSVPEVRDPREHGTRRMTGLDSRVWCGAAAKGRSSSVRLNAQGLEVRIVPAQDEHEQQEMNGERGERGERHKEQK